jgi:cytochrome c oxidase cbb3-type subunit III
MRTHPRSITPGFLLAALAVCLAGCRTEHGPERRRVPVETGRDLAVRSSELAAGPPARSARVENPYQGNVHALREGERLYAWYNCAGCHGAIGGGSIGPPLRDDDWIYGGTPGHIYQSIVQGRPNGMPTYASRLSEDALWKLVAYVSSLGDTPAGDQPVEVPAPEGHERP